MSTSDNPVEHEELDETSMTELLQRLEDVIPQSVSELKAAFDLLLENFINNSLKPFKPADVLRAVGVLLDRDNARENPYNTFQRVWKQEPDFDPGFDFSEHDNIAAAWNSYKELYSEGTAQKRMQEWAAAHPSQGLIHKSVRRKQHELTIDDQYAALKEVAENFTSTLRNYTKMYRIDGLFMLYVDEYEAELGSGVIAVCGTEKLRQCLSEMGRLPTGEAADFLRWSQGKEAKERAAKTSSDIQNIRKQTRARTAPHLPGNPVDESTARGGRGGSPAPGSNSPPNEDAQSHHDPTAQAEEPVVVAESPLKPDGTLKTQKGKGKASNHADKDDDELPEVVLDKKKARKIYKPLFDSLITSSVAFTEAEIAVLKVAKLEYKRFPKLISQRGLRLINFPPQCPYPGGRESDAAPHSWPKERVAALLRQLWHPNEARRCMLVCEGSGKWHGDFLISRPPNSAGLVTGVTYSMMNVPQPSAESAGACGHCGSCRPSVICLPSEETGIDEDEWDAATAPLRKALTQRENTPETEAPSSPHPTGTLGEFPQPMPLPESHLHPPRPTFNTGANPDYPGIPDDEDMIPLVEAEVEGPRAGSSRPNPQVTSSSVRFEPNLFRHRVLGINHAVPPKDQAETVTSSAQHATENQHRASEEQSRQPFAPSGQGGPIVRFNVSDAGPDMEGSQTTFSKPKIHYHSAFTRGLGPDQMGSTFFQQAAVVPQFTTSHQLPATPLRHGPSTQLPLPSEERFGTLFPSLIEDPVIPASVERFGPLLGLTPSGLEAHPGQHTSSERPRPRESENLDIFGYIDYLESPLKDKRKRVPTDSLAASDIGSHADEDQLLPSSPGSVVPSQNSEVYQERLRLIDGERARLQAKLAARRLEPELQGATEPGARQEADQRAAERLERERQEMEQREFDEREAARLSREALAEAKRAEEERLKSEEAERQKREEERLRHEEMERKRREAERQEREAERLRREEEERLRAEEQEREEKEKAELQRQQDLQRLQEEQARKAEEERFALVRRIARQAPPGVHANIDPIFRELAGSHPHVKPVGQEYMAVRTKIRENPQGDIATWTREKEELGLRYEGLLVDVQSIYLHSLSHRELSEILAKLPA